MIFGPNDVLIGIVIVVSSLIGCGLGWLSCRPVKSTDDHSGGADVG
jgi:hypothetical protein